MPRVKEVTTGSSIINTLTHFSKINEKYIISLIFNHNLYNILRKCDGKYFGSKSHTKTLEQDNTWSQIGEKGLKLGKRGCKMMTFMMAFISLK
jgi:hypothetical protein